MTDKLLTLALEAALYERCIVSEHGVAELDRQQHTSIILGEVVQWLWGRDDALALELDVLRERWDRQMELRSETEGLKRA